MGMIGPSGTSACNCLEKDCWIDANGNRIPFNVRREFSYSNTSTANTSLIVFSANQGLLKQRILDQIAAQSVSTIGGTVVATTDTNLNQASINAAFNSLVAENGGNNFGVKLRVTAKGNLPNVQDRYIVRGRLDRTMNQLVQETISVQEYLDEYAQENTFADSWCEYYFNLWNYIAFSVPVNDGTGPPGVDGITEVVMRYADKLARNSQ